MYEDFLSQSLIPLARYAREVDGQARRETWGEIVERYWSHMSARFPMLSTRPDIKKAILAREVMGSMRAITTASHELRRNDIAAYNCAFHGIDRKEAFGETLLMALNRVGVGFSVERKYVDKLPIVPSKLIPCDHVIRIINSPESWQAALQTMIDTLYGDGKEGKIPRWDISQLVGGGTKMKDVFMGYAPDPEGMDRLLNFTVGLFQNARGRKLRPIECFDLSCETSAAVNGVRLNPAMSCLFDASDIEMLQAKTKNSMEEINLRRYAANISMVIPEHADCDTKKTMFENYWKEIADSGTGEPGLFNLEAAKRKAKTIGRKVSDYGVNPCGEVILRSRQFCNLTEVIIKPDDIPDDIKRKVEMAAILGTCQAAMTNFVGISESWKKNCEEESLLGVSLTGIYDNTIMSDYRNKDLPNILNALREHVAKVNRDWAKIVGINPSAATTTIKPSGTVSLLSNCSSGIHPRHSRYYIRRIRLAVQDPIAIFMKEHGFPHECDATNSNRYVFAFPFKSPDGTTTKEQLTAIEHLKLIDIYNTYWAQHNVSATVAVKKDEWLEVGRKVHTALDSICGITFFPHCAEDAKQKQLPLEKVSKEQYDALLAGMPENVDIIAFKETGTFVDGVEEYACSGGKCETLSPLPLRRERAQPHDNKPTYG